MPHPNAPSLFEDKIRKSLLRHRDESPISLSFRLSVTHLLDAEGCLLLTQELQTVGSPWEHAPATPELADLLPTCRGLYMFVWHPPLVLTAAKGRETCEHNQRFVLYVGKAAGGDNGTIRGRYKNEYQRYVCKDPEQLWNLETTAGRQQRLRKYLSLWPLEFWHTEVETSGIIRNLETRLIKMLSPPLNVQLRPRFKLGRPESAFS